MTVNVIFGSSGNAHPGVAFAPAITRVYASLEGQGQTLIASGTEALIYISDTIEQVGLTRQSNQVVGALATRSGNNEQAGDQYEPSLEGYGGSDSFSETLHANVASQDMDIEYGCSKTAINVTLSGNIGTVTYGAAGTRGTVDYQAAGAEPLGRINEFGDSNCNDAQKLGWQSGNMEHSYGIST